MRIGINAFALGTGLDGSQTYVRNLMRTLATMDQTNNYSLLVLPSSQHIAVPELARMERLVVRSRLGKLPVPLASSLALLRARLDLVHVQFAAPLLCPTRIVVTVHDIMFDRHPEFFTPSDLAQLHARVPRTLRRAAAVLTGSDYSRDDIIRQYGLSPEKIVVTPYAADPVFAPVHDPERLATVRARYGTGDQFVLFAGALKPNKNLPVVVDAYVRLRRAGAIRHRLVLVGAQANQIMDDVFVNARHSGYAADIVLTGHVPTDDLVALYSAAELFVQPSLFEGFGLPVLEAMTCGTAVITSNVTSIPEVAGDAALLIDPRDVDGLAEAMRRVLTNTALRRRLETAGLHQAARFSWRRTAQSTLQVYDEVAHSRRHSRATPGR